MSALVLRCFRCDKRLEPVVDGTTQPYGGLTFEASGNYGSTVFDASRSNVALHAVICDDCVTDWADRLVLVAASRPRASFAYRPVANPSELFSGEEFA